MAIATGQRALAARCLGLGRSRGRLVCTTSASLAAWRPPPTSSSSSSSSWPSGQDSRSPAGDESRSTRDDRGGKGKGKGKSKGKGKGKGRGGGASGGASSWGGEDEEDAEEPFLAGFRSLQRGRAFSQETGDAWKEDGAVTREALRWHRADVQRDESINDALLHVSPSEEVVGRWWDDWEADWDEGWDWEQKWRAGDEGLRGASQLLVGQDDPRRPKGPLMELSPGSGYRPVASLNHSELTAAIIAARNSPPDELQWQALCRRAELVAVSLTPAELLAVARCIGERQSGQLRLLWKLASLAVERITAFTAEDLVCLAHVYSSLDAVHHGLLNVVALMLANSDDDLLSVTPMLAVALVSSFARAGYPLPLLLDEARRSLLQEEAREALSPEAALEAMDGFVQLGALDGELLAALLPVALMAPWPTALPEACAAARWALSALGALGRLEAHSEVMGLSAAGVAGGPPAIASPHRKLSGEEAKALVLTAVRTSVLKQNLQLTRIVGGGPSSSPLCLLPLKDGGSISKVDGHSLLTAAELLLSPGALEADLQLAASLLNAVSGSASSAAAWSPELQVRWLRVAAAAAEAPAQVPATSAVVPLLSALAGHAPGQLVPHAAAMAKALPRLLQASGPETAVAVTKAAAKLCSEVTRELFRLRLSEARETLEASLQLVRSQHLPEECAVQLRPLAGLLLQSTLKGLSAKFKAECVFHRRGGQGPGGPEVAAWCTLLADSELLGTNVAEELWQHLAEEAKRTLAAAGLGEYEDVAGAQREASGAAVAVELLQAFNRAAPGRGWSAVQDLNSPLGAVAAEVQRQWRRAVARDGEREDPMHEPAPIPAIEEQRLRELFHELGLKIPS